MNVQALIMAKSQQMNSRQWSVFLARFQNDQLTFITVIPSVLLDGLNSQPSGSTGFRYLAERMKNSRSEAWGCNTRKICMQLSTSICSHMTCLRRHMVAPGCLSRSANVGGCSDSTSTSLTHSIRTSQRWVIDRSPASSPQIFVSLVMVKRFFTSLGAHIYNSATTPLKVWEGTGLVF